MFTLGGDAHQMTPQRGSGLRMMRKTPDYLHETYKHPVQLTRYQNRLPAGINKLRIR